MAENLLKKYLALSLMGKRALVTGGSRGIGRAVAFGLAREGANVAINYLRDEKAAQSTGAYIKKMGRDFLSLRANLGNPGELEEMFQEYQRIFQKLDIFVHCASLGVFKSLSELSILQLNKMMGINTYAFIACAQQASKLMTNGGQIIGVSSLGSQRYITDYGAVGIAKAGLESAVRYLAVELAEKKIHVNAVSGGPVDTTGLKLFPNYRRRKQECIERTPFHRLGSPEDIARVVLFLCKPESFWICGQVIIVDGGLSLRLLTL